LKTPGATTQEQWLINRRILGQGDKAIIGLGRYLYKGVIWEKDTLKCETGMVTFFWEEGDNCVQKPVQIVVRCTHTV